LTTVKDGSINAVPTLFVFPTGASAAAAAATTTGSRTTKSEEEAGTITPQSTEGKTLPSSLPAPSADGYRDRYKRLPLLQPTKFFI
jgi:hypothetical protein